MTSGSELETARREAAEKARLAENARARFHEMFGSEHSRTEDVPVLTLDEMTERRDAMHKAEAEEKAARERVYELLRAQRAK